MVTKVKFLKKLRLKKAVLFTGLPGIGLVGKIAVDYMLRQLKAEKIAEITSDSFPPSVHTKNGLIDLIKDEIFYFKNKSSDFLFLAGPVQPALDARGFSMAEHYEFAQAIVDELGKVGVTEIYTLAGLNIGDKRIAFEPKVIIAATNKQLLSDWKKFGVIADRPEGLISGAAGLLLGVGKDQGMEGACLMGETNAKLIYGDQGSAKKIIELLVKKYGFKIDMGKIEKEAKEIEASFSQLAKQLEGTQEEEAPQQGLTYVR